MRLMLLAAAGVAILGACASLVTPAGSAATRWAALEKSRAAKAASGNADKICKNMTVMGSNFPQRVCSTQAEWDQFNEQTRQSAEEFDAGRRAGNTDSAFERGGN